MRYLDVCSGISAPTAAWKPLGWQALCFAEIEAAPRAVLTHHYPAVPLRGDFTEIRGDEYGPVDLLVGGTPCQDFSVAGLRAGLGGERGNLTLEFLKLLGRTRARWVVWENVPGVLSSLSHDAPDFRPPDIDLDSGDGPEDGEEVMVEDSYDTDESHAFACFLAGLSELGYGWAYRVLDAQFTGVPQRRRREFVVGYLGDWRRAAAVLFERHSLSGHPAPRREAGQDVADGVAGSLGGGSNARGWNNSLDVSGAFIPVAHSLRAQSQMAHRGDVDTLICGTLTPGAHSGSYNGQDAYTGHLIAHSLRGEGFDASEDGTGRGTPLVACVHSDAIDRSGEAGTPSIDSVGRSRLRDQQGSAVRRLTPRECERLQGFPDDFTLVPYRKGMMADGPRYKMLGNSMAVPVIRWIGERIAMVDALAAERAAA